MANGEIKFINFFFLDCGLVYRNTLYSLGEEVSNFITKKKETKEKPGLAIFLCQVLDNPLTNWANMYQVITIL